MIFNKKLKEENNRLKLKLEEYKNNKDSEMLKIEEYYEKTYKQRLEYEKMQYNSKITRKKKIEKLCELIESRVEGDLENLSSVTIEDNINALIKLLNYLKEV